MLRTEIRRRGYSYRTEKAYVHWCKRMIYLCNLKHPKHISENEITSFLNGLAV